MFVVQLKFSVNKGKASEHMAGHKEWLSRGFDDGVFLLAGSLQPNMGGAILAHNVSFEELQERVSGDPFVREEIVRADIVEITPTRVDPRLQFALD